MNDIDVIGRLTSRIDALRDGTPEVGRLIDTLWEVLERYVFLTAYVAANRDDDNFPQMLVETMEDEDRWRAEETDPDVIAFYRCYLQEELEAKQETKN